MALLKVPIPEPISDEQLVQINDRNAGWKIERGREDLLEARLVGVGVIPRVGAELAAQLGNWKRNLGGGRCRGSSAAYNLSDAEGNQRARSPSVSWISQARIDSAPRGVLAGTGFPPLCPDFVIEVRSPYDRLADHHRRMAEWLHFGVRLGWLVDPIAETAWIYRPGAEPEMLPRPSELSGETILDGLVVDLTEVWAIVDEDKQDGA